MTENQTPDQPPTLDQVRSEFAAGAPGDVGPLAAAYERHLDQKAAEAHTLANMAVEHLQASTATASERIAANRAEFEQLAADHGVTLPSAAGPVWEDPATWTDEDYDLSETPPEEWPDWARDADWDG